MKSILTIYITLLSLLQFSSLEAQTQPLYAGISLGVGATSTHLDENISSTQHFGLSIPIEAFLGYRFSSSFSTQLVVGNHLKNYAVSPNNFFQTVNVANIRNVGAAESNIHVGVNLLFRQALGSSTTKHIGGLVGYSKTWYPSSGVGVSMCTDVDFSLPSSSRCIEGTQASYSFGNTNNSFLLFGVFYEKGVGKKANKTLRFGLNFRKGIGDIPVTGELYHLEEGDRAETVNFYSNGSMLSFEVGYMFGFGKRKGRTE